MDITHTSTPVQVSFRIDFNSREWLAIKEMAQQELDNAIQNLLNMGKTEAEHHNWRGRATLAKKLLDLETGPELVTNQGE